MHNPRSCTLLFVLVFLLFSAFLHAQNLPKAPNSQIFTLSPNPGSFSEPSVAVNPQNPQQVVAVFQDNAHASYSQDAGGSWTLAQGVDPKNYRVSGDVSVAFDNQGHAFICYIAFDKLGAYNYWGHGATRNGIFVRRSLDGGKTWEPQHVPVAEQPSKPGIPFEDKPYIVADNSHGKYAGNLYVGWTRWSLTDSRIVLSRSTDDGKTWSPPHEIDAHPGLARDDNGSAEGFSGTVDSEGKFYAVWSQGNDIMFTKSGNGGRRFSHARRILRAAPMMFAVDTLERANGFPQIAVDPRNGRLYVLWSDYRNGDLDVFVSVSRNHGRCWSRPVRVNDDPIHNGVDQFFQWLAVDPTDGSVNVVFYDRRRDPLNRRQIVVLARSTDGGRTFKNYAWTDIAFDAEGVFLGDYSGLAAYGGRVYGAWTEKPPSVRVVEGKSDEEESKSKLQQKGTVVKLGTAEFAHQP
jgi:hypothetical protein